MFSRRNCCRCVYVLMCISCWGSLQAQGASGAEDNRPPDPAALLRAYEQTLVPYQRMKGTWTSKISSAEAGKPLRSSGVTDTWTVVRDQDRARLCKQETGGPAKSPGFYENVLQSGKTSLCVYPDGNVIGQQSMSAEDTWQRLGMASSSPSYGFIGQTSIPARLEASKLSVETGTLDGRRVDILHGVSEESELTLWLDPALGHTARKISFAKRGASALSYEYEVKRFRQIGGVSVPQEAAMTLNLPQRPVMSCVVRTKIVDGKAVPELQPAKDAQGNIMMSPASTCAWEITLAEIDFDPKLADSDLQISQPIPDGTRVSMKDTPPVPHVGYAWSQGKIVRVVEAAVRDKFVPTAEAKTEIADGLKRVEKVKGRVLVMYGTNSLQSCSALEEAFQANPETLWPALDEFEVVYADWTHPANRGLAAEQGLAASDPQSPCWVVLDYDGKVLGCQDLTTFEKDGRFDAEKLLALLKQWAPTCENAEEILRGGLEQAAKEQKNLFVVLSGTFCGPCRRLEAFLEQQHELLEADYVVIEINLDCTTHTEEVLDRLEYPQDTGAGVPWCAILSPAGERLITSDGPEGNIAFPTQERHGIEHFLKMLRQTSSHLSPEQLRTLEESLTAADANGPEPPK